MLYQRRAASDKRRIKRSIPHARPIVCAIATILLTVFAATVHVLNDEYDAEDSLNIPRYGERNGEHYASMPWNRGIWKNSSTRISPTFEEVADYANNIEWKKSGTAYMGNQFIEDGHRVQKNRFLHIINPYSCSKHAEAAQNLTLASMEAARAWAEYMLPGLVVDIVTVESSYSSDDIAPWRPSTFLKATKNLTQTAFDVISEFNTSISKRPLPLLREILEVGTDFMASNKGSPYTHVIFTNTDIGVMPHFYWMVDKMATCVNRSFFLNRVEIPEYKINNWNKFHLRANLSESLADEPIGLSSIATAYNLTQAFAQQHPGYDCLVARAKSIPRILQSLGNVFTAYPPVGSILCEAVRVAEKDCVTSKGIPATFHVGTRNGNWENDDAVEYMKQNAVLAKVARNGLSKRQKCRAVVMSRDTLLSTAYHKCFPFGYYNKRNAPQKYMFPVDFQAVVRSRNRTRKAGKPPQGLLRGKVSIVRKGANTFRRVDIGGNVTFAHVNPNYLRNSLEVKSDFSP